MKYIWEFPLQGEHAMVVMRKGIIVSWVEPGRTIMRTVFAVVAVLFGVWPQVAEGYRDHGSWMKTLHDKAVYFEKNTAERHNILGTYPSSVRLVPPNHYVDPKLGGWKSLVETGELPPGWTFDHGTTGPSNIAHTSSWTATLITAEAFRVAFLRDNLGTDHPEYKAAYARANEIIGGFRILTLVSGQPGYLVRGIALGHGISYEERSGTDTRDLWAQGVGEYKHLRYRGGPSHHNYDQVFRGLGIYYFVAADDAQKEAIRAIVSDMSNWAHLAHDMRVMLLDGKHESTVLIGGWRGLDGKTEPSGGSLMATTGLKIAYTITGNKKVKALYDKWVNKLGYRDSERTAKSIMGSSRGNYDDTDHLLGDLYVLNLIEKDPDLLRFYRKCVKDSWEAHKTEKMSWFNYVYGAVLGEEYSDAEGSLWNLQNFPTCRIFQPQLNSIRTDIEFTTHRGRKEALYPLPVHRKRSDNEYEWKGSPFALDGWLSRITSVVEVSPIDPYVIYASDTSGGAYMSLDKGELWRTMGGLPSVSDFLFSPDYQRIAFAATSSGIYRTMNGGRDWSRVSTTPATQLILDPGNSHVLYAVGPNGISRSVDLGEQKIATVWNNLTDPAHTGGAAFAVDVRGDEAMLYRMAADGLYTRSESDTKWTIPPRAVRTWGFGSYEPVGGHPLWIRVDETMKGRLFCSVNAPSGRRRSPIVIVSDDNGKTWTPIVRELDPLFTWASETKAGANMPREELAAMMEVAQQFPITDVRVDVTDSDRWYGLMSSGVAITENAGKTWRVSRDGLDIPQVHSLSVPRESTDIYVGTPAGLYISRDRGQTWSDTSLILQYSGVEREEIGGSGYLTAYWMGRYHNFIDEETATAQWWK